MSKLDRRNNKMKSCPKMLALITLLTNALEDS